MLAAAICLGSLTGTNMLRVNIHLSGDKELQTKLKKLGPRLMMFDEAMHEIGKDLTNYYANTGFTSQGGVYGNVWARLKPATTRYKAKHYAGAPPEYRTGALNKGFRYAATSRSVLIDNKMPYFAYQSLGTNRGLPARQMIGINKPVMDMIGDAIQRDIEMKLRDA